MRATVLSAKTWPPGSFTGAQPRVPADQPLFSVELQVTSAQPAAENLSSLAEAGATLEVFSARPFPDGIVGKSVDATITLTGTSEGVRWMLQTLSPLP